MGRRAHHIKKFAGGRATPQEVHQQHAFPINARCGACPRRPITRVITLAPLDEAMKRYPQIALLASVKPEVVQQQAVMIRESGGSTGEGKLYVRIGIAYACKSCTPALEREAAKAPSWCIVEINRGPKDIGIITSA